MEHPTVDSACELFPGKFMEIEHECIGTNTVTIRPNDKISMTSEIRRELRVRDRLRKKFIQSKSIFNERKYKDQRNKVNNLKKSAKIEFYVSINETLSDLKNVNSKQYWKTIKMLIKGECSCSDLPPIRLPHEISPSTFDNIDQCNNHYFCSISDLQDEHTELPDFDNRGRNTLTEINIQYQEILDVISLLNTNKPVGPDRINNRMLKEVMHEVTHPLCLLFNKSKFPKDWKLAHVIPIFKSGDTSLVSNYRPIALLCTVSKIFEKVVCKYIFNFLVNNALIYKFQSGFIPGHSTSHQLIELTHESIQSLDNQELICLIFCNVSKAFDRIWLRGLLLKLERYGIKGNLLRWLESYISNREQHVIIKDTISMKGNLKAGVPQGSNLVPLLFLIFINDIANDMLGLCRLFADYTSVSEKSLEINHLRSMVNIDLNNITHWAKQWLVKLNLEIVYFSTRTSPVDLYFSTNNIKIKPIDAHKHLGVTLSADGKWSKHINNGVVKASVLRKIKFKVSRNFLENIYMTFIGPLLEYSCEAWDSCTGADAGRLEQLQLEAARIVTGLRAYASLICLLYMQKPGGRNLIPDVKSESCNFL